MSIEDKFHNMNCNLQQKVLKEIEDVRNGLSKKNILQLETILSELRNSENEREIVLSYPRLIIDSWDYSDLLGKELIELAELYKRVR